MCVYVCVRGGGRGGGGGSLCICPPSDRQATSPLVPSLEARVPSLDARQVDIPFLILEEITATDMPEVTISVYRAYNILIALWCL